MLILLAGKSGSFQRYTVLHLAYARIGQQREHLASSERHGSACARCADGALSGALSVYGRGYHTTEARIPRPLDYEGFASCSEKESVARTRRSPAMDAGRELLGIFSSLLLLYSWCACSGMSCL